MMPKKKSETIKIYLVAGLSLVFVIIGYFRLIHGKSATNAAPKLESVKQAQVTNSSPLPKIEIARNSSHRSAQEPFRPISRDIFESLRTVEVKKMQKAEKEIPVRIPSFKLRGTIVGGEKPIAIINDRYVRKGESIEGFKVVSIRKTEVLLSMGEKNLWLELLQNE